MAFFARTVEKQARLLAYRRENKGKHFHDKYGLHMGVTPMESSKMPSGRQMTFSMYWIRDQESIQVVKTLQI